MEDVLCPLAERWVHHDIVHMADLLGCHGHEVLGKDLAFAVKEATYISVNLAGDDTPCTICLKPVHDVALAC